MAVVVWFTTSAPRRASIPKLFVSRGATQPTWSGLSPQKCATLLFREFLCRVRGGSPPQHRVVLPFSNLLFCAEPRSAAWVTWVATLEVRDASVSGILVPREGRRATRHIETSKRSSRRFRGVLPPGDRGGFVYNLSTTSCFHFRTFCFTWNRAAWVVWFTISHVRAAAVS